ncbi:hydrophobin [Trichoderma afarasin]|uniref:Class II hydrophobin Hyd1 n=2 Tax=Trichoderma TaxID=5543 RepID=A0A8G0P9S6_9HYPO|nr:Class II hydrophobin Hyd1 [Trichoderma simmonsii]
MKFFAVAALFVASAMAGPMGSEGCPGGLTGTVPLCCATNVLDIADLDCSTPTIPVPNVGIFQAHCASKGKQPVCCTLPIAGQGLLCNKPTGAQ